MSASYQVATCQAFEFTRRGCWKPWFPGRHAQAHQSAALPIVASQRRPSPIPSARDARAQVPAGQPRSSATNILCTVRGHGRGGAGGSEVPRKALGNHAGPQHCARKFWMRAAHSLAATSFWKCRRSHSTERSESGYRDIKHPKGWASWFLFRPISLVWIAHPVSGGPQSFEDPAPLCTTIRQSGLATPSQRDGVSAGPCDVDCSALPSRVRYGAVVRPFAGTVYSHVNLSRR